MKLPDAIALSKSGTAFLHVNTPGDPCHRGTNTDYGITFIWYDNHLFPYVKYGYGNEQPKQEDCMTCNCGDKSFPRDETIFNAIVADERWEPSFPREPLEALANAAG